VFQAIPVPVVGSLIAAVESHIEKVIRTNQHEKHLKGATPEERVKFKLKELSVEELDRHRWKVVDSINELNKASAAFPQNLQSKRDASATCDAYLELAMAVAQAKRRIERLKDAVMVLMGCLAETVNWVVNCESGTGAAPAWQPNQQVQPAAPLSVLGQENAIKRRISDYIKDDEARIESMAIQELCHNAKAVKDDERAKWILYGHGKCDRWCCFRAAGKPDNWKTAKDKAANVLRALAEPIGLDDFNNNLFSLWDTGC
jgi:hypothetical protein